MDNKENGQNTDTKTDKLSEPWRYRLIAYIERKLHEREAKKKEESPADKAARRTATATVWIAVFTIVLALVGAITLIEIMIGGSDTHDLAVAAGKQADAMKGLLQYYVRVERGKQARIGTGHFGIYHQGPHIEASLIPENTGDLEAVNLKYIVNLDFAASAPKRRVSPKGPFIDMLITVPLKSIAEASITKFVDSIRDAQRPNLYVTGEIWYSDLAGDLPPYRFCYSAPVDLIMAMPNHVAGDKPVAARACDQPED